LLAYLLSTPVEFMPNGLTFSCRARIADHLQNANDLAREAVSCNAV
jgi:hypothetical protein